jgi:hypothetical protein
MVRLSTFPPTPLDKPEITFCVCGMKPNPLLARLKYAIIHLAG